MLFFRVFVLGVVDWLCHLVLTDNEKRCLVFGIALKKILIPHLRPFVEQQVNKEYNKLKTRHSIDSQSASSCLEKWHKWLKYENINGNDRLPLLPGECYDYCNFNCQVRTHTDFAKLYLQSHMIHFNAFDDHMDALAVLLLLGRVPVFPGTVQTAANSVRNERNDWAHCVISKWNETKFQHSFAEMEDLVKAMALPSSVEEKIVGELKDWQNKGTQLCMNSPVDQALLQLIHQNIQSLENEVKNWSDERKEEREKVQRQLQKVARGFKEINQRLLRLETGHQRLETKQQRLETGQQRLDTGLKRSRKDHERWKTKHLRLESYTRDLEQRVIHCEANPERLVQSMRRNYKKAVLCPFPWCEDELQFELDNIFTRLQIVSREKERSKLTDIVINMTDVFQQHPDCENPRVLLIEGDPAIGKTTFCEKLAHDWSLKRIPEDSSFPKVEMLLLLKCRDMNMGIANIQEAIADQLLPKDVDRSEKENFFQFIRAYQSRILLLLDGLDELDELKKKDLVLAADELKKEEPVLDVIKGKKLSNIYLLLTARTEMRARVRRYCDSLLQIVGYTEDDANSYIENYFRNHSDPSLAKKLKNKLVDDDELKELTDSPMNTALLCLLCEETNGTFPTKQTELYECLVSCAIKRYFKKKEDVLSGDNPSEGCREQLNQLGKMALEALLENRHYFSKEEMKSEEFLHLFFVKREPSRSKMKPTECYAFTHKTFQEYVAALYLANEVLTDSKESEALLLKVSPVDNWQVWKFLFPMVSKMDGERAVFLVSCLAGAVSRDSIPEENDITETAQFQNCIEGVFSHSFCSNELYAPWYDLNGVVNNALDVIADCQDFEEVLNDCQRKMLVKLAECIPLDNFKMYIQSSRSLEAFSEYLNGSRTLTKLQIFDAFKDRSKRGLNALAQALHTNCVLTHLDLADNDIGDEAVVALGKALESNTSLTFLDLSIDPDWCEKIGPSGASALAKALMKNSTLKCLVLASNSIEDSGAREFANALRTNSSLTQLDLFENDIGRLGTKEICEALQSNHVMTDLILSCNTIDDSGVEALAKALQSPATQLSGLHLLECEITSLGVKALAGALQTNRSLTHLNLAGSLRSCSARTALVTALQSNRTLTHLNLNGNRVSDTEAILLAETLRDQNNTLTYLVLHDNAIGAEGKAKLELVNKKACVIDLGPQN
ncbi:PREDICTED: nucleotide-binding oligomerization domain-containing protein 2-like [Acropora digitifera]|uniref:nucleotide-binding oligomerization domain-containing protein 2-like n=1 Tax=Acropora digitifera TaxID=70779 RepID=UPI00077ABE55|nr:PREDICTED: nucleotide-binding oligomerization domain-containing protein 2-like [Acropora digitifera]